MTRWRPPGRLAIVVIAVGVVAAIVGGVAAIASDRFGGSDDGCRPSGSDGSSVARLWNEASLAAIRSDFPAPTVHARNLYHSSAAMWDAWAAYDPAATGLFVDEEHRADEGADRVAAREEAMSFAAYRVLRERYRQSPEADTAVALLDQLMDDLCYDADDVGRDGDDPAAVGNRIGATILAATVDDGSNEVDGYVDPDYAPVNPPLVVGFAGTEMVDPNRWQPLELEVMVAQNGLPLDDTTQTFVGSQWGAVTPFALSPPADGELPIDPGPPPRLGDPVTDRAFKESLNEVIAMSAALDGRDGETIDLSPATQGNAPLGSYDAAGYDSNPVTGDPYPPDVVARGDYGRVVAEFWADGPGSETPPGHWNVVANAASDSLAERGPLLVGGDGEPVDRLEWDVKLYLALNGAMHDAAIAAWAVKAHYDSVRPISAIRYLGDLGQSSDPTGPSYHPDGLLLEDGLVEVITEESSAPGERHDHLPTQVGRIAIRAWRGPVAPPDPLSDTDDDAVDDGGGVGWMRAVDWVPYQRPTFVTPAFAGYVSGHSTFSRAGAEVLTAITGSPSFPGGIGRWSVGPGELDFEDGPNDEIVLQWATYRDAADEAGLSRLYGGIHIRADDLAGREMGAEIGTEAWARAQTLYSID